MHPNSKSLCPADQGTGLAITSTFLFSTVKLGNASSTLTADEKEERDCLKRSYWHERLHAVDSRED